MDTLMMLLVSWFLVFGHITGFKLPVEEDKILETQLKYLNKPIVTTIQMIHSHDQQNEKLHNNRFDIWLNGKGCQTNTVPIKRVTKEELAKINIATGLAHRN
ncbi:hypothetical protein LINPERHAP2_LOCUS11730 [Linum perenne]